MFGNRKLRVLFGPKKNEVTGGWSKLHYQEPHSLYSPNMLRIFKSRRTRRAEHVFCTGETRSALIFLVGEPERKNPLKRLRLILGITY
jgi:hypothetical protein